MKKTLVYIAPHLSTGGMPQYLFKQIESVMTDFDVYCIEWDNVTGGVLVVQRNKISRVLGDKLITLGENKNELFDILNKISPDIIHLQEIPELFMPSYITDKLYTLDRKYVLIETSHDSGYDVSKKSYLPDKFLMVSKYQTDKYEKFGIPTDIVEYPIENKIRTKTREQALRDLGLDPSLKHVINVGLFTPRKNQAEVIEYARILNQYPIQFHFIGNQADNFKDYWEPLMQNFPSNCKWWNERSDVDRFYEAADLFLFTSRGHATDMETMPLVIREALSWKTPSMIYNLPVYMGYFDTYDTIEYLTNNIQQNAYRIAEKLLRDNTSVHVNSDRIFYTMDGEKHLAKLEYLSTTNENAITYGDAAAQYYATFLMKELEYNDIRIQSGDVFVDLGANIGMSSLYAKDAGASEIHTFEPDPELCKILIQNVPTANLYQYAISDTSGEVELYHWPYNPVRVGPKYKTTTLTLSDVLRIIGKKINYLKMDIEGFEEHAFDTLTDAECRQIEKMMIEYHNVNTVNQFCNTLRRKGFQIVHMIHGYQTIIYAKYTGMQTLFTCSINIDEQKIFYSSPIDITDKFTVSVKDIDSHATMWSVVIDYLPANAEYWVMPIPKRMLDFSNDATFGGVRVDFYINGEVVQTNEFRLRHPTVEKPKIDLPISTHPIYFNYMEFFVEKIYDKYITSNQYDVVVDVGANVGVWAKYIEHKAKVNRLYLVEPNREALQVLNVAFTELSHIVVDKALSDKNGYLNFYVNDTNSLISSLNSYDELNSSYKVESLTVRKFINNYNIPRINLLKVDIEAAEYDLFYSLTKEEFDRIDEILVEYHLLTGRTQADVDKLIAVFEANGYSTEINHLHNAGGFIFCRKK